MGETVKHLQIYLQHKERDDKTAMDWNKAWNDLLKNVSDLTDLVSPRLGLNSLHDVYQFIIALFKYCLKCPSCNIQSVNLAFKFASATLILENIDFLNAIIPCLLNTSMHMLSNTKSTENNIFFQYIQFIFTNNKCKTLNIWNDKTYRKRCLALVFDVNNHNKQLQISYRHLCLLMPWYLLYFQDLLPFISKLYQQIIAEPMVINTILQCDSIKYINNINNTIDTLQLADTNHIESIICILIYNNNFNYNNFDILHFNKLVDIIRKVSNHNGILLLFEKLCEKYSVYCINNERFNAIMNEIIIINKQFKSQSIQDVIEKSKAKIFDDNILLSVLLWSVILTMVFWLTVSAAGSLANEKIFELNHSVPYLPDIIHDNFSQYFWKNNSIEWHMYSDWILSVQFIVGVIVIFTSYPQPFHFSLLYLKMYCILLLMRVITFTVTVLPTALPECKKLQTDLDLCDISPTFFCNDFMFSGHTTTSWLLMMLYYLHIFRARNGYIYWYESKFIQLCKRYIINLAMFIQLMASILMIFVLTFGHVHYTVDIVIALYLICLLTAVMWRSI